ncbi:MAG: M56 family metallopeptidase [Clostridiales bacterium]|nr:M56 family metallopeptidase [Clostridiales bacterium]
MLRYMIGISIITVVILIVRKLADGKIRRRYQYAVWLILPLYMIVFPFLKINVPVAEELSAFFPVREETVVDLPYSPELPEKSDTEKVKTAVSSNVFLTDKDLVAGKSHNATASNIETSKTTVRPVDWIALTEQIILSVAVLMIAIWVIYNTGFIFYCKKNRRYLGRDSVSRLKIFRIDHRETPFLLFNNIYVDSDRNGSDKYIICHEACHFYQLDYIWIVVRYLVLMLNWYNPFIWTAFVLSGRDCELSCDEEVIGILGTDSSAEYARTLYEYSKQRSGSPVSFTVSTDMRAGYRTMIKRLSTIKHPGKNSSVILAMSIVLILAVSACALINPTATAVKSKDSAGQGILTGSDVITGSPGSVSPESSDGIKWTMDDIKILNDISKVSIYSVYGDLGNSAVSAEYPDGYSDGPANANETTLYTRGFKADETISRDIYAHAANSQSFIDISTLPEEITGYAEGYDLLNTAESEEFLQSIPLANCTIYHPIQHISIRQQVDGIPTMPLRRGFAGKSFYYKDIEEGAAWTFSQRPVNLSNDECTVDYLIIPGLKIKETVEEDLDVIPFEKIREKIRNGVKASVVADGENGIFKNKLEDVTVTAAEVCYIMIYDNSSEYEKSTKCYLYPFWVVYYKCGIESGLTQQGAAFFPAVEGIRYI